MSAIKFLTLFFVLALAVLVGCGSGSSESPVQEMAIFVRRSDAICRHAEEEKNDALKAALNQLGRRHGSLTPTIEEGFVTKVALPPIRRMGVDLAKVETPKGREAAAEAMWGAFKTEVERLEADPASVVDGSGGSFARANKLAKEFGMKYCAAI